MRIGLFCVIAGVIDIARPPVNAVVMDADEPLPLRSETPIAQLVREDLDRLSVTELHARVATLEGEIARTQAKIESAVNHRASADALFRR